MADIKIDINDIALGVYGLLLKRKLITPDEYHLLKDKKIKTKEELENGDGEENSDH